MFDKHTLTFSYRIDFRHVSQHEKQLQSYTLNMRNVDSFTMKNNIN